MKKFSVALVLIFLMGLSSNMFAQSLRGLVNDGVNSYEKENFADAETKFRKGLDKEYETFEGHFNLGSALYKQGKYEEAINAYKNAIALTEDDYLRSKVMHNIGNTLLKSQKIEESVEAYKNSLRLDPDDLETKYNLSYALNMLDQQQQQQQQQDQNQDQQDQDQENQDQENQQDQQNQEQQNQDQQQEEQQQNPEQQQQKPKEEISKEEAQRILQALKQNEADLQKELRKRKAKVTKKEKDW